MLSHIVKRLFLAVVTLVGISFVTFMIINLAPGDPASLQTSEIMDPEMSNRMYEDLREYYGLNDPIMVRYAKWLGRMATLDFGESMSTDRRLVLDKIGERIWPTVSVSLLAVCISLFLAVPVGLVQAAKQNSPFDTVSSMLLYALYSVPSYVMAMPLILYIGVKWDLLPFQGMRSDGYDDLTTIGKMIDLGRHYVLITFCTSFGAWAYYSRFVRQNMLEVVRQDYIRTARAKGLKESKVIFKHAFRNTMIPMLTLLGLMLPSLVGGSVILEVMFNWPGLGRLFFESMLSRDYPTIMAMSVISATLVLLGMLLADLGYAWADPRVRYE